MATEEMLDHYATDYDEAGRLKRGAGRVEWLRTMEVLSRHLPPPPASIIDVGGGTGAYALPLAAMGYRVHLIDAVESHVERAKSESAGDSTLASAQVGDARRLVQSDETADAVLLLGPLYHLTDATDRQTALNEAARVLRSGGVLAAAAISRFASTCDGLRSGFLEEEAFEEIVERDLQDGQHRNPSKIPGWFTTAYFHRPDELRQEVAESGFENVDVLAVEGPAWLLHNLDDWLSQPESEQRLLKWIRRIEAEPTLVGVSAHLLAVGRKP